MFNSYQHDPVFLQSLLYKEITTHNLKKKCNVAGTLKNATQVSRLLVRSGSKSDSIVFNFCFEGSMWRLPAPVGVRSIRRREEDPHHVSAEGAVRSRGGETSHRAPEHRGKKANDETRSH